MMLHKPASISSLIGHKGKSYNIKFSETGEQLLSASEDSTAKLWHVDSKRVVQSFEHNKEAEVLRVSFLNGAGSPLCTCGADGDAIVWRMGSDSEHKYQQVCKLRHGDSQIYACEALSINPTAGDTLSSHLLTAADDDLHVWDLAHYERVHCWNFSSEWQLGDGVATFGGPRNPDNLVYIFDAKVAPKSFSGVAAVALSDGSVARVDYRAPNSLNRRTLTDSVRASPAMPFDAIAPLIRCHVTSISWLHDESELAITMGNGVIAIMDNRMGTIRAVFRGHRGCCFGAHYLPNDKGQLLSWSSDTSIRLWDSSLADGLVDAWITGYALDNFPVYDCAIRSDGSIACAGGGNGSFMGYPIHLLPPFSSSVVDSSTRNHSSSTSPTSPCPEDQSIFSVMESATSS